MIPKFKIGDKVQAINYEPKVLTIKVIYINKDGISYYVNENMACYCEFELDLYVGPKVKKYKYVFESIYTDSGPVVSSDWYENDDEFEKRNPFVKEFERIDLWSKEE